MKNVKKINVIMLLIFVVSIIFSNGVQAVGSAFSDADDFLSKRRFCIKHNKYNTTRRNIELYV